MVRTPPISRDNTMTRRFFKVLLADDDKELLKGLALRFWDAGYELIATPDGNQVLELAKRSKPDLIILDVNMPTADGFSLHEQLKQDEGLAKVPVIYLTGDRSPRLDAFALQQGAVALFHKPCPIKELVATVTRVLQPVTTRAAQAVEALAKPSFV